MGEYLSHSRVLETYDIDEANMLSGKIWERLEAVPVGKSYGLRWNLAALDCSALAYAENDGYYDAKAQGPLSDTFRVGFFVEGAVELGIGRRALVAHPQCATVLAPGTDLTIRANPFKVLEASLSGELVRAALQQRFRDMPAPEDWVGALPQSGATETLRGAVEWMAAELERPGSPLAKPGKPRLHAERMLLSLFVECLAETAPAEIDAACSISEMQARMAEAWIEAHLTEPIGVEEIANAVGVGVRSLQLSFQRARGCSPTQAISRYRLERARKELLNAPPGATVTTIAADLGIFDLSRFAKRYRERFEETPSETLMRQRR